MPEGHTIHSAARRHRRILVGYSICVSSPQGRFSKEALKLNGNICMGVEAYGKHLVYEFCNNEFLHVHLGLFGSIRVHEYPASDPRDTVRVRLAGNYHAIDIIGPTICEIYKKVEVEHLISRIGPDPLRDNVDPEQVFTRISKSRSSIGKLLMDQSVISGIGNIYRTEILWRQSIHPHTPGRELTRSQFQRLWYDIILLLNIGVKRNAIVTTEDQVNDYKKSKENLNVFAKSSCPRCDSDIVQIDINGRRAYFCDSCQTLNS